MKKAVMLVVVSALFVWTLGCATSKSLTGFNGGGGGGGNGTIQSGNWAFTTNGGINGTIFLGGNLTSSGTTVSGSMYVVGSAGSGFTLATSTTPMAVTGTLSNGTLTLGGTLASSTFAITFTGIPTTGTAMSLPTGNYTVTGGTDTGDSGSISGVVAGSYSGTWAGTDTTTNGTMTVSMTEGTAVNPDQASFPLTPASGTGVTFSGVAGCAVTGTLNPTSFVAGSIVFLQISTTDNGVPGKATFLGAADDPATPANLGGAGYIYTGGSGCMLQNTATQVSFSLTKQ